MHIAHSKKKITDVRLRVRATPAAASSASRSASIAAQLYRREQEGKSITSSDFVLLGPARPLRENRSEPPISSIPCDTSFQYRGDKMSRPSLPSESIEWRLLVESDVWRQADARRLVC